MDEVLLEGDRMIYRWTLDGTNTGPGGIGKHVQISGFDWWNIGPDGLIAELEGSFDQAEYKRQML